MEGCVASIFCDKQDTLFRALYLRREFQLLSTVTMRQPLACTNTTKQCGLAPPRSTSSTPIHGDKQNDRMTTGTMAEQEVTTRTEAFHTLKSELQDILLLPPSYPGAVTCSTRDLGQLPESSDGWPGLVFVRDPMSPWHQACFEFTVHFPLRYPFDPPIVHLARPLRSHPFLLNRVEIPFEEVYCSIDPMRVSVLLRLLQHVRDFFLPTEWPTSWWRGESEYMAAPSSSSAVTDYSLSGEAPLIDSALARQDVERCSILQEIVLSKPYVNFLATKVIAHFLKNAEKLPAGPGRSSSQVAGGDSLAERDLMDSIESQEWSAWYNRNFLLRAMQLP